MRIHDNPKASIVLKMFNLMQDTTVTSDHQRVSVQLLDVMQANLASLTDGLRWSGWTATNAGAPCDATAFAASQVGFKFHRCLVADCACMPRIIMKQDLASSC